MTTREALNESFDSMAASALRVKAERDELLAALKAWEHWYSEDSTEFKRDEAREMGLKAIAKAEGR